MKKSNYPLGFWLILAGIDVRIGEVLDAKVAEGFARLSARDVWERLDEEGRSVESVFGLIRQVVEMRLGAG